MRKRRNLSYSKEFQSFGPFLSLFFEIHKRLLKKPIIFIIKLRKTFSILVFFSLLANSLGVLSSFLRIFI